MPKKEITLLETLAVNCTVPSQRLLLKYKREPGKNYPDIVTKLAALYGEHPDKIEIEKEFALMHPHKDFILKHCVPATKEIELDSGGVGELRSNCAGNPDCHCNKASNACGCSGIDGSGTQGGNAVIKASSGCSTLEVLTVFGVGILIGALIYRFGSVTALKIKI